jgi:hypothetical protein
LLDHCLASTRTARVRDARRARILRAIVALILLCECFWL